MEPGPLIQSQALQSRICGTGLPARDVRVPPIPRSAMFGGRDSDNVDEVMGRDEGDKDNMLEEAQSPGRSEAGEVEATTDKHEEAEGKQKEEGDQELTGPAKPGLETGAPNVQEAEGPSENADGADREREGAAPNQKFEAIEVTKATQAPQSTAGEAVSGSAASAAAPQTGDAPHLGRSLGNRPSDSESPPRKVGRTAPATPIATPVRASASPMATSTQKEK